LFLFIFYYCSFEDGQQKFGKLVTQLVIPTIATMYVERQQEIIQEIQSITTDPIPVSVDAVYASRNNNSDHGAVTIVEHLTKNNYLVHIAMKSASSTSLSHQLESQLVLEGLKHIVSECKIPIDTVGRDGKRINQADLDKACNRVNTFQVGDGWHAQKKIVAKFVTDINIKTKCVMGNIKQGIVADSKEVKAEKMNQRAELLTLKEGLGFHFMQCAKVAKGDVELAQNLWQAYAQHKSGDHEYCVDEDIGLDSIGEASCVDSQNPSISEEALNLFKEFLRDPKVLKKFEKVDGNISTSINESVHNIFNSYRDKLKHYTYYNVLYQMAYLDFNENRNRKVEYTYTSHPRDWKRNHKFRTKREVLSEKTYMWQDEALRIMFPNVNFK
jgi:hypothetical protein